MVDSDHTIGHEDVLHDDAHPHVNRIVALGIDESEYSEHALKWGKISSFNF